MDLIPDSILGRRVVDMLARYFVGDNLTPADNALLPTRILTPGTINQASSTARASTSAPPIAKPSSRTSGMHNSPAPAPMPHGTWILSATDPS